MPMDTNFDAEKPDAPDISTPPPFFIVSPNPTQSNILKTLLDRTLLTTSRCHADLSLQAIIDEQPGRPCFYLLDCQHADLNAIESYLHFDSGKIPNHIMVTLYNVADDDQLTPLVRRYQIRGIFFQKDSQAVLIQGIKTILDGHLWLTRKMLSDCVRLRLTQEDGGEPADQALNLLTGREKELLRHLFCGESNQEIADSMQISLHTVKSHLYNIYRKIDVPNRLQAILWAATYMRDHL